jgi:hypothetical protein
MAKKVSALVSWVPCTAAPGSPPRDFTHPPRAILIIKFCAGEEVWATVLKSEMGRMGYKFQRKPSFWKILYR